MLLNGAKALSGDLIALGKRQIDFYRVKPSTSTLFLTYRCNSKCRTCSMWQKPQQELEKQEIGLEQWKAIIDQLAAAGIRTTELFGGNVLLRKDLLIALLEHLDQRGIATHLPTNQIGLDDEVAEAIVRFADAVYISTDGPGDRQDEIRGVKNASRNVELTITKLRRLREDICSEQRRPRLICNNTVSRFNAGMMEEMADYAEAAGFDELHFEYAGEFIREEIDTSLINGLRPDPYYVRKEESILVDRTGAGQIKESIRRIKEKRNGRRVVISTLNIDTLSEGDLWQGTIPHKKCYVERNEVTVDPSGHLVICPFINNYLLGSLVTGSLEMLWNNERHRDFRRHQNSGRLPMCRRCILGVQRNPGIVGSLKRIYYSRIEPVLRYG